MNQKGNIALSIVLAIVGALLVLGAGMGVRYYSQKKVAISLPTEQPQTSQQKTEETVELLSQKAENLKIYRNGTLGFEFKYPKEWSVSGGSEIPKAPDGSYYDAPQDYAFSFTSLPALFEAGFSIFNNEKGLTSVNVIDSYSGDKSTVNVRDYFSGSSIPNVVGQRTYRIHMGNLFSDMFITYNPAVGTEDLKLYQAWAAGKETKDYFPEVKDWVNQGLAPKRVYDALNQMDAVAKSFKLSKDSSNATEDYKTYTNNQFGFEFKYPKQFTPKVYNYPDPVEGIRCKVQIDFEPFGSNGEILLSSCIDRAPTLNSYTSSFPIEIRWKKITVNNLNALELVNVAPHSYPNIAIIELPSNTLVQILVKDNNLFEEVKKSFRAF